MGLLIICLTINLVLLVVFKLYPRFGVNNLKAIVVNYFICLATGTIVYKNFPFTFKVVEEPWFLYGLLLGIFFIIMFNVIALTLQKVGATIGTIFQRMSLLFPVFAAFLFFGEQIGPIRWIGILVAILCIVLINLPEKGNDGLSRQFTKYWYLPILTLLGSGLIEGILFFLDESRIVSNGDVRFVSFLFFSAGTTGLLFLILKRDIRFNIRDILGGIFLGVPNFFSIYLLLKLLSGGMDASVVFPFINVGTILAGTLIGVFVFNEKLNRINLAGVILAIVAIFLIIQ